MIWREGDRMHVKNRKGFTLAELLIVVAIIAILVAVAIPIFHAQLRKARFAVNQANARSAFSAAEAAYIDYVSEHGSIKANSESGTFNTVTYTYFTNVGKGILNFQITPGANQWIVSSASKICENTDVSRWNVDTIITKENDTNVHSAKAGDLVARVWTIHMDPANGQIKGYYCAFPGKDDADLKKVINAFANGTESQMQHTED